MALHAEKPHPYITSEKDIEKGKVKVFKSVKEARKHFGD